MFSKVRKSRSLVLVMITLLVLALGAGCAKNSQGGANNEGQDGALSGSINISGSTSVQPLSEELGQEFMDANPNVKINVAGGGSSAGVKAAQDGTADIGASSRELKDDEKSTVQEVVIAKDGIAVIVNPSNGITGLTMEQVKKIFLGEIKNWKEVGGKDAPISVVTREDGSGTRGAFEEIVLGKDQHIFDQAIVQNSTGAIKTTVASDPNGIGYVSMGALKEATDVKGIKVDEIDPTEENAKSGTYKISRPFIYLVKNEPQGAVKAFIDWVLGEEGQALISEEYISVK